MIVPARPSWLGTITTIRGSTIVKTWPRLISVTTVATLVTWLHQVHGLFHTNLTITPFTLIGIALGIFLGFRNTTSYERYWEGRKLWGGLVNTSRSFCRQVITLIGQGPAVNQPRALDLERALLIRRIIAFSHALRQHLRDQTNDDDLRDHLPAEELAALAHERNRPFAISHFIALHLRHLYDRGWIHPLHLATLDQSLSNLVDLQGGCERIKSTPIPFSYNVLLHSIVFIYCFALPFGLVDIAGLNIYTPVVVLLVSYAFFGLDAVGDEVENPFGEDPNDLPLSAITRTIEINLLQRLGVSDLPPPLLPRDEILL